MTRSRLRLKRYVGKCELFVLENPHTLLFSCTVFQLASSSTVEEFRAILDDDEYSFRFDCGVTKASCVIPFSEKDKVVSALCLHFSTLVTLAELEQLKRGLMFQKLYCLMEEYPSVLRAAFLPPVIKITSELIQDMFHPIFSPSGSNQRQKEEGIIMDWIAYLEKMEGDALLYI